MRKTPPWKKNKVRFCKKRLSRLFVLITVAVCLGVITTLSNRVFSQQSSPQPTLTSMRITAQLMSISDNTAMKMTFNESYDLNVSLIMADALPFPENSSTNIDVLSVTDGVNDCTEQPSPLAPGTYLINYTNNYVEVLPRATYQNNVSKHFDVQVVFMVANHAYSPEGVKPNIPFYEPYEREFMMVFNFSNFWLLKPNFELFQVNIVLPSGVDQVQSQNGTPMLEGSVDTGWTIIYNYVEPTDIPTSWIITVEQPSLRNLFYQQVDTLFLFAAPFIFSLGLYFYTRKMKIKIVLSYAFSLSDGALTGYLVYRVIDSWSTYQSLNDLRWFFTFLLGLESIFALVAVFLFAHPLIQKVHLGQISGENKTPNDEKPDNINPQTNDDDNNQKVKDTTNTVNKNKTPTQQSPE
jgi:hypothetical protein